jgi:hypothetical protein
MSYLRNHGFGQACYPPSFSGPLPEGSSYCDPLAGLPLYSMAPTTLADLQAAGGAGSTVPAGTASGPCIGTSAPYAGWRDAMGLCQPSWLLVGGVVAGLVVLLSAMKR